MNRLLKLKEIVALYHLPQRLHEQLAASVKPVEENDQGEPLFLETQVDAWLTGRYITAGPRQPDDEFLTTREIACLLRCSYSEARERMLDGRIKVIRDGRWLRTRRAWVEQYVAEKTIKPVEADMVPLPAPRGRRHVNVGVKLKKGGIGERFLRERARRDGSR